MKKWTFLFVLASILWSCDNNDENVKVEDRIIGNWELSYSEVGSDIMMAPMGGLKYVFNDDNTFLKSDMAGLTWRDEGTWVYNEETKKINFTYKTYSVSSEPSETKLLDKTIQKITSKELVLKAEYNDTNMSGEFVEYQFVHYLKK